jgi:leader peptidase (prepilin peptidase)/N-methyltransferase
LEAAFLLVFGQVFAVALGLILGSFVNVLIYRLPIGRSVVFPRSRCPACGVAIAPYDNIPLLSYLLLLRGRCRYCGAGISPRYPLVEALIGTASLVAYLRHGPSLEYAVELAFVSAMVALVVIDYRHRILPDAITVSGTAAGLLLAGPREALSFWDSLAGALAGGGLLFLVAEVYFRLRKLEGLGMGDVKMMAMVGSFLGWKAVLLTIFLGSLGGSVVGVLLMAFQGRTLKTTLPFGTFLGVAAAVAIFAGEPLLHWYTSLF